MSKQCRVMICLCVLTSIFLINVNAEASSITRSRKIRISIGGGYGRFDMSTLNKYYIDAFAREFDILTSNIDGGPHWSGEIGYFVTPVLSTGIAISYMSTGIEHKSGTTTHSLSSNMFVPELRIKAYLVKSRQEIYLGGGLGYGFGKARMKVSYATAPYLNEDYKLKAQGVGFGLFAGCSYRINPTMLLGMEIGYRHYNTGDLKDPDGGIWYVSYPDEDNPRSMKLEFSGAFVLGKLLFDL